MKQVVAGRPLSLQVPVSAGSPPDFTGLVITWTVESADLTLVATADVPAMAELQDVVIPGSAFVLAPDSKETYLWVTVTVSNAGLISQEMVQVIARVPLTKTAADVRGLLGVSEDELEDAVVDLYSTYLDVNRRVGLDVLADLSKLREANDLILYHEAIKQTHTLHLKALAEHKIDDHHKKRFGMDLQSLLDSLWSQALSLEDFVAGQTVAAEPLVSFATTTDVITGA